MVEFLQRAIASGIDAPATAGFPGRRAERERLAGALDGVHGSATWRVRERVLQSRLLVGLYRALSRLLRARPARPAADVEDGRELRPHA